MVAVTDVGCAVPAGTTPASDSALPADGRRVVAVAVSPLELLRPGSDLARMIDGIGPVDVLFACENEPVALPSPLGVLSGSAGDAVRPDPEPDDDADDDVDPADELRAAAAALGLVDVALHRLALPAPLTGTAEPDLVAALSELVGFDPEPGVQVLAPVPMPGDPQRSVVDRAVCQIVQVYGLPLLTYRCLELSVVDD